MLRHFVSNLSEVRSNCYRNLHAQILRLDTIVLRYSYIIIHLVSVGAYVPVSSLLSNPTGASDMKLTTTNGTYTPRRRQK